MAFQYHSVYLGCDPEFFFKKDGKIIGSEKIIDRKVGFSQFIVDGVQAELNPGPETCRAYLANSIAAAFRNLKDKFSEFSGISADFSSLVKVSKEELMSLDESSRKFGCAPSKNALETSVKMKNPNRYLKRSAGGHIHLGKMPPVRRAKPRKNQYGWGVQLEFYEVPHQVTLALEQPERVVRVLDIVLGNTCVLLDRDPGNVERRKMYGRAGEYRVPAHGLEYRTLSNFWLKAYPLMSFVMAMARWGVMIVANSIECELNPKPYNYEEDLLRRFNQEDIKNAINNNDFVLAKKNFEILKQFIMDHAREDHLYSPLIQFDGTGYNFNCFEYLVEQGIDKAFPFDPVEHWATLQEGHRGGWETFTSECIALRMQKKPIPASKYKPNWNEYFPQAQAA